MSVHQALVDTACLTWLINRNKFGQKEIQIFSKWYKEFNKRFEESERAGNQSITEELGKELETEIHWDASFIYVENGISQISDLWYSILIYYFIAMRYKCPLI